MTYIEHKIKNSVLFNLMVLFPYCKALEIDPSVWVYIALHFPSGPLQMKHIHKVQPKEAQSLKSLGKRAGLQRGFLNMPEQEAVSGSRCKCKKIPMKLIFLHAMHLSIPMCFPRRYHFPCFAHRSGCFYPFLLPNTKGWWTELDLPEKLICKWKFNKICRRKCAE